ncbi:MAG: extracellular solute-binding protein [Lachnospiraceae bacterium]|nr:extracellular solute-binding protein [Lachnospiraceae bacterium]MDD3794671.1 extracellular solute-binding protein [Lachnospiraceae bacterium]
MKRAMALALTGSMVLSAASAGCVLAEGAGSVELNVTTTFAGEDGNAQNFKNAVDAWCEKTGNTVSDTSATSDESFKTRVVTDFETGSEPDVLFFFNGADANSFIEAGKVISLDDIRAEYPDYASNMNDDLIVDSLVDGKKYAVPVNGYWEAMFVNTEILEAAGVEKPGADTTMEDFIADCQKIKDAGYTPIACALGNIPHYWWEYSIFNHTSPATHLQVPASVDDEQGQAWVAGMEDIKTLYDDGFFPENTLSGTDDETFAMFTEGKAAFLIDGSWKVGGIASACQSDTEDPSTLDTAKLDKFDVTYVPGNGDRKATDLIGGLSMGYYITQKAWEDPDKRAAAVDFVSYMTSDELVPVFAQHTASALKAAPEVDASQFNSLQVKAMDMMSGVTSLTGAVQDLFQGDCRVSTFDGMPEIVSGKVSAADAVKEGLDAYNK